MYNWLRNNDMEEVEEEGWQEELENDECETGIPRTVPWIYTMQADVFFGSVIAVNALAIGVDIDAQLRHGGPVSWQSPLGMSLFAVQVLCVLVFLIEVVLRFCAEGCHDFFDQPSNLFDLFVVLVSITDLAVLTPMTQVASSSQEFEVFTVLRILQLLRLVRIIGLLTISRELTMLVMGLVMSLKAMFWVFLLLLVFMYIGALYCCGELGIGRAEDDPLRIYFGSIGSSLYSHFKVITLEAWPDMNDWAMEESFLWAFYFVAFIVLTHLALVNLMTGIIMEGVIENAQTKQKENYYHREAIAFAQHLRQLEASCGVDPHSTLDKKQFKQLLSNRDVQEFLDIFDVSLTIDPGRLFDFLDWDCQGSLKVEDLPSCLLMLRGSKGALHPVLVRQDVSRLNRRLRSRITASVSQLRERHIACVQRLEDYIYTRLDEVRREAIAALRDIAAYQGAESKLEEAGMSEGSGCQLTVLVREAFAKVRLLDGNLQEAEAELRAALQHEADLRAELALQEASRWTQTEADLPAEIRPEISQSTQTPEQWVLPWKKAPDVESPDRLVLGKSLRKLHDETAAPEDLPSPPPSRDPQILTKSLTARTVLGPPVTQAYPASAVPKVPSRPLIASNFAVAPIPPQLNSSTAASLAPIALEDIRMSSAKPPVASQRQPPRKRPRAEAPQRLDLARRLRERADASGAAA